MRKLLTPVHGTHRNRCFPAGLQFISTFKSRFKPVCSPVSFNWHLPWLPSSPDLQAGSACPPLPHLPGWPARNLQHRTKVHETAAGTA